MQLFEVLNSVEKTSCIWEQNFKSLLSLVKEFIVDMWEVKKHGNDSYPNQLQSQSSPGGLGVLLGLRGKGMVSSRKVYKLYCVYYTRRVSVACNVYL